MPILGAIFEGNKITIWDTKDATWFTITKVINDFTFEVKANDNDSPHVIDVNQIVRIDKTP